MRPLLQLRPAGAVPPDAVDPRGAVGRGDHRIIDEVRAEGCLFLAFTGGEALVHPGLVSFVEHARSLGTYVRLKSNGVLLTDAKAKELVHAGVSAVDISLYGAAATTHDAFVMRPGAFVATIEGAKASGTPA